MFPQTGNTLNNPVRYGQVNPYTMSQLNRPPQSAKAAGGRTLLITAGIITAAIIIGMSLGLGLGIGAAGIVSSANLINVTNRTNST